jgi:hypothetical protein
MFIVFVVVFLILAAAAYLYVQHQSFNSMVWKEVRELAGDPPNALETVVDPAILPAPLRRYLAHAIEEGRAPATFVRMRHGGTFRRAADDDWLPITGTQYYATSEPAFVWVATMKMNPFVWVRGRDKYADGRGHMLIRLLSAVTVADATSPEMDQSTLLRYISEMPWFPTAFLTVPGIGYVSIDDDTFELHMTHGGSTVRGRFTVDAQGDITEFLTEDRYRDADGEMLRDPWRCRYGEYRWFDGMRIPVTGEACWLLPEGEFPYGRFRIERMEYDIPAPF